MCVSVCVHVCYVRVVVRCFFFFVLVIPGLFDRVFCTRVRRTRVPYTAPVPALPINPPHSLGLCVCELLSFPTFLDSKRGRMGSGVGHTDTRIPLLKN